MADDTNNMVLRTLYLPRDVDQALKSAAIRGSRSKGDLIRELIKTGLEAKRKEAGSYFAEPSGNLQPVKPAAMTRTVVTKGKAPRSSTRTTRKKGLATAQVAGDTASDSQAVGSSSR